MVRGFLTLRGNGILGNLLSQKFTKFAGLKGHNMSEVKETTCVGLRVLRFMLL